VQSIIEIAWEKGNTSGIFPERGPGRAGQGLVDFLISFAEQLSSPLGLL
jgi:hypothetical protein